MSGPSDRCELCGSGLGGYPYMLKVEGKVLEFCCQACVGIYEERSRIQTARPSPRTHGRF